MFSTAVNVIVESDASVAVFSRACSSALLDVTVVLQLLYLAVVVGI